MSHDRPPQRSGSGHSRRHAPKTAAKRGRGSDRGDRGRTGPGGVWLFGLHAVRDALLNPRRERRRLILTPNARQRLGEEAIAAGGLEPEMADPRRFPAPLDPQSVHQGAALEAAALDWGSLDDLVGHADAESLILLLDRVTDPHNVGAVLRSAEVFGARAVVAPARHSAPETGALAKTASGALERQPYLRVRNLGDAMLSMKQAGWTIVGLDGSGERTVQETLAARTDGPLALALGAEGPGLRERTRELCDVLARIPSAADFASLNVSNAAAVALYAARTTVRSTG